MNEIWINLPVKNIEKSANFFTTIGFTVKFAPSEAIGKPSMLIVGNKSVIVMLYKKEVFEGYAHAKALYPDKESEVLFSISVDNKKEVDDIAEKVKKAGGTLFAPPENRQRMYGCGFMDLDGHRWNIIYMEVTQKINYLFFWKKSFIN